MNIECNYSSSYFKTIECLWYCYDSYCVLYHNISYHQCLFHQYERNPMTWIHIVVDDSFIYGWQRQSYLPRVYIFPGQEKQVRVSLRTLQKRFVISFRLIQSLFIIYCIMTPLIGVLMTELFWSFCMQHFFLLSISGILVSIQYICHHSYNRKMKIQMKMESYLLKFNPTFSLFL